VATRTSPLKRCGLLPEKISVGNVKDLFLRNSQDNYSRIRKPVNEFAVITHTPAQVYLVSERRNL